MLDPLLALMPGQAEANALGGIASLMLGRVSEAAQRLSLAFDAQDPPAANIALYYAASLGALGLGVRAAEVLKVGAVAEPAWNLLAVVDNLSREQKRAEASALLRVIVGLDDPWLAVMENAFQIAMRQIALKDADGARVTADQRLPDGTDERLAVGRGLPWVPPEVERGISLRLSPDLKRMSSGWSGVTAVLSDTLRAHPAFDDVLYFEGEHVARQSPDHYLGAWRSVNDIQSQLGPKRFTDFLARVEARITGLEYIETTYRTRAWTARLK